MSFKNVFLSLFSKENIFYTIVIFIALVVLVTNRALNGFTSLLWLADFASLFGVIYVVLIAKHNFWGLVFNLLSSILLVFINIYQKIYFTGLVCLCISIPSIIFAIINWKREDKQGKDNLNVLTSKGKIISWLLYLVVAIIFGTILYFLNGNLFYLDALYSAGITVGLILCARAYIDQFAIFIVADIFAIIMYLILCVQNLNNISLLFMVFIFEIVSIKAHFNWKSLLKNKKIKNQQK